MNPFTYERAADPQAALSLGAQAGAKYLGGGTNLVDLMRETIEHPSMLIDVTGLFGSIDDGGDGGLKIGAGVKNTALAADTRVRQRYPLLSEAILAGASAQIRNMATVGGNLLQRTRCGYFYDDAANCNKRTPGAGCDAMHGFNRMHAILGASDACIATHPSDMAVAMAALDARVAIEGRNGAREVPLVDFLVLPGDTPQKESVLEAGELITAVTLPPPIDGHARYRKVRDRASYAFALVSVAAIIDVRDGVVNDVRLALGGVAHKPWRALAAESALKGGPAKEAAFQAAAQAELAAARALADNAFKIRLAERVMVDTLVKLTALEEVR
jgi:xanthine dehydrogenase YagS FAD-binding subunit